MGRTNRCASFFITKNFCTNAKREIIHVMEKLRKPSVAKEKTVDPLAPKTLIAKTEQKLFGFKCEVRDGTLAEREVERRIHTFFAVLADSHISLIDTTSPSKDKKMLSDLLPEILLYLSPIYREADKELSTANILTDLMEFFQAHNLVLEMST